MQPPSIDFAVVENTMEARLRDLGVPSRRQQLSLETGYKHLRLQRAQTEVLAVEDEPLFFASVEINAAIEVPTWGAATISDLVSTAGASPEKALAQCAHTYMDVTFPALQALFDAEVAARNSAIKLATYTQPEGRLVNWRVFTGQLQVLDKNHQPLTQFVGTQPPLTTIIDTISDVLSEPRLHWCKLYGSRFADGRFSFGCAIDGRKSLQGEDEMRRKFAAKSDAPAHWEFRQFCVFLPDGAPDAKLNAQLQHLASASPQPGRRWPFFKKL